jgi:hypothetical protein
MEGSTLTDKRTASLACLAPKAGAQSLKSEFFAIMPAIEAALKRGVTWKAILADLEANGFAISPETATNYAAQYRRRYRQTGVPGKPGRPRKSDVAAPHVIQTKIMPVLVTNGGRPATRSVANLKRPADLA